LPPVVAFHRLPRRKLPQLGDMGAGLTSRCMGQGQAGEEDVNVPEAGVALHARTVQGFGWKPDLPDFRDQALALPLAKKTNLPPKVDLRLEEHFGVYDQGHLGSCTANAIGAAFHYDQVKQGLKDFKPSRLYIYYNERAMEGHVSEDSGAQLRDGIKCLHKLGACHESMWPYVRENFTKKPSPECYEEGRKNRCLQYARVTQSLDEMKACLNEGFPYVFGFIVLSSFMTEEVKNTGIMLMPTAADKVLGGHAVMAVGYDDDKQCFIIRNSWGEEWGDKGYFWMPYRYMCHHGLVRDLWAIKSVEGTEFPCTQV